MVSRTSRFLCVLLAAAAPGLCATEAEEKAAEVFESLFGADVARVARTRDAADDIALAKRLLDTAKGDAADKPALVAVLCEKAYDLSSGHADGYATAAEAAEFLAAQVPAKAAEGAERLVTVRQKQYALAAPDAKAAAGEALVDALLGAADAESAAGDLPGAVSSCRRAEAIARAVKSDRLAAVAARGGHLAHRLAVHREIENMKALVGRDPGSVAARERLVRLYLVDLDDPAAAAENLEGVQDESLRKYVPAAGKGAEAAPELACMELGDWYRSLGEGAPEGPKAAMFARAKAYYDRFLSLHPSNDLDRTAATVALKKIEEALAKLGPAATAPSIAKPTPGGPAAVPKDGVIKPGRWVDLLPLVDIASDAITGTWERQGDALAVTGGQSPRRLKFPVAVSGSYQCRVRLLGTGKTDTWSLLLCVGDRQVYLTLNNFRRASGLAFVRGRGSEGNETTVPATPWVKDREYVLDVIVTVAGDRADIKVLLDSLPHIAWSGPVADLSLTAHHQAPWLSKPGSLGLATNDAPLVFRQVSLRMLSGEAKVLRPPGGAAVPSTAAPAPAAQAPTGQTIKPGTWVDLLALVDPSQDAASGRWGREGAALAVASGDHSRCALPVVPTGSYDLKMTFVRKAGSGGITTVLPVGAASVLLEFSGWQGRKSWLGRAGGTHPDNQLSVEPGTIENGHPYTVGVAVRVVGDQGLVTVALDGKPFLNWQGPVSSLSVPGEWQSPKPGSLAVGSDDAHVLWGSVSLKMLTGEARLLRPPGGTGAPPACPTPIRPGRLQHPPGPLLRLRGARSPGPAAPGGQPGARALRTTTPRRLLRRPRR